MAGQGTTRGTKTVRGVLVALVTLGCVLLSGAATALEDHAAPGVIARQHPSVGSERTRPTTAVVSTPAAHRSAARSAKAERAALRHLLVKIPDAMPITARPGGGRVVGTMPAGSKYYEVPLVAWVIEVSANGRFGLVTVPYSGSSVTGWIPLEGLERLSTGVTVRADLSDHEVVVERRGEVVARFPAATGAAASPTPPGIYFVTDRVPFDEGSYLGSFAFGISGIQTKLPAGWDGGNQLAIHGTNNPGSIGTSASAGCLRVSEAALDRMKPLLQLGTPVIITA